MKIFACFLGCVLLCPVVVMAADPFNYDYVELGYDYLSPQTGSVSKGPDLAVSYTLWNGLQIMGGYARLDTSAPVSDITDKNYFVGIRGESNFNESTDFFTDILYIGNHNSSQNTGSTDNGYRLALGLRHLLASRLEFDGSVGHNWLDNSSNDATAGLLLNATSWLAVGLSYSYSSLKNNTTSLHLRVYF